MLPVRVGAIVKEGGPLLTASDLGGYAELTGG